MKRATRTANMTVAVAYIRVSTEGQDLGPEAQRAALDRWAAARKVRLVAVHEDRVSGAAPLDKRPGLMAALDSMRAHGAGLLVVAKRDRLARDVALAALLTRLVEREGAKIASAAGEADDVSGPEGMLLRGMLDLFSAFERELIRARTKAALAVKHARGEKTGGDVPFGFKAEGGRLLRHEGEQEVIRHARALRAEGLPLREIGARLEARGLLPRSGGSWHPTQISRLLEAAA